MFLPSNISETSRTVVFGCVLNWWSRYIWILSVFMEPIWPTIEKNLITKIEWGDETAALGHFPKSMETKLEDSVYNFRGNYTGMHSQSPVLPQQCDNPIIQWAVSYSETCDIHFDIGALGPRQEYDYWLYITGDLRTATRRTGNHLIHDQGRMTASDHPNVKEIAGIYLDWLELTP